MVLHSLTLVCGFHPAPCRVLTFFLVGEQSTAGEVLLVEKQGAAQMVSCDSTSETDFFHDTPYTISRVRTKLAARWSPQTTQQHDLISESSRKIIMLPSEPWQFPSSLSRGHVRQYLRRWSIQCLVIPYYLHSILCFGCTRHRHLR
jgi:hypothetical protein